MQEQVHKFNIEKFLEEFAVNLKKEVDECEVVVVEIKKHVIGKWTMTRLWRKWMSQTAEFMSSRGVKMPLYIDKKGRFHKEREFNNNDAHELFTATWLGHDEKGNRYSWARSKYDNKIVASVGLRVQAMQKHEAWAIEKGLILFQPRESEYRKLVNESCGIK